MDSREGEPVRRMQRGERVIERTGVGGGESEDEKMPMSTRLAKMQQRYSRRSSHPRGFESSLRARRIRAFVRPLGVSTRGLIDCSPA
jgi:hypothetical protein